MGYTQNCEIWQGTSLGILIMIQEKNNLKDHVRTMFWPQKGHILAISWRRGPWDTPCIVKLGM